MDSDITKMWQWDQNYPAGTLIPGIFNDAFIHFIVVRSTEHHIVGWLQTSSRCGRKRQKPNLKHRSEFPCRDSGKAQETLWEQPPSELRFEPRYSRISTETFSEATATSHEESNCTANIEPGTTEIRSWSAVHPTGTFSMLYLSLWWLVSLQLH